MQSGCLEIETGVCPHVWTSFVMCSLVLETDIVSTRMHAVSSGLVIEHGACSHVCMSSGRDLGGRN